MVDSTTMQDVKKKYIIFIHLQLFAFRINDTTVALVTGSLNNSVNIRRKFTRNYSLPCYTSCLEEDEENAIPCLGDIIIRFLTRAFFPSTRYKYSLNDCENFNGKSAITVFCYFFSSLYYRHPRHSLDFYRTHSRFEPSLY